MNDLIPFAQSVLHTTDFSDTSNRAFAHALAIALLRQTELTVLHCGPEGAKEVDWDAFPQVRQTLQRWGLFNPDEKESDVWRRLNMTVNKRSVQSVHPGLATVKFLAEQPHDLVVLATDTGNGFKRWLRHSTAETITRFSRANTLFVPSEADRGLIDLETGSFDFRNILVPVDQTPDPQAALEYARRAAELLGDGQVSITVLHVGDTLPDLPPLVDGEGWRWQVVQTDGDVKTIIQEQARDTQADLIVMASAGVDSIFDAFRGSTSEQVLRQSTCPVLVIAEAN